MSGLSRSCCSSASISPFVVTCGRGADLALAAVAGAGERPALDRAQDRRAGHAGHSGGLARVIMSGALRRVGSRGGWCVGLVNETLPSEQAFEVASLRANAVTEGQSVHKGNPG